MDYQPRILTIYSSITACLTVLLIWSLIVVWPTYMTEVRLNLKLNQFLKAKTVLFNTLVWMTAPTSADFFMQLEAYGAFQRLTRLLIHREVTRSRSASASNRTKNQPYFRWNWVTTYSLTIFARQNSSQCPRRQRCYFMLTMAVKTHYRSMLLLNHQIQ